jgi:hypothetical protein
MMKDSTKVLLKKILIYTLYALLANFYFVMGNSYAINLFVQTPIPD